MITSDGGTSTHVVTGKVRTTLNFCTALCSGLVVNLLKVLLILSLLLLLMHKSITFYVLNDLAASGILYSIDLY